MKTILLLFIIFCFTEPVIAQLPGSINDWDFFALRGSVQSITIKQYAAEIKNGKIVEGEYMMHPNGTIANRGDMQDSMNFNQDGFLIESFYFPYAFNDINFFTRKIYLYDDNNREKEMKSLSVNRSIVSIWKDSREYDSLGRLSRLSQRFDTASKPAYYFTYSYTTDPFIINSASYSTQIGLLKYYTYNLDSLKRVTRITDYNKDSTKDFTTAVPYNERFYVQKEGADKKTGDFNQYFYDKKGNWIKMIAFNNTKPVFIIKRSIIYFD